MQLAQGTSACRRAAAQSAAQGIAKVLSRLTWHRAPGHCKVEAVPGAGEVLGGGECGNHQQRLEAECDGENSRSPVDALQTQSGQNERIRRWGAACMFADVSSSGGQRQNQAATKRHQAGPYLFPAVALPVMLQAQNDA